MGQAQHRDVDPRRLHDHAEAMTQDDQALHTSWASRSPIRCCSRPRYARCRASSATAGHWEEQPPWESSPSQRTSSQGASRHLFFHVEPGGATVGSAATIDDGQVAGWRTTRRDAYPKDEERQPYPLTSRMLRTGPGLHLTSTRSGAPRLVSMERPARSAERGRKQKHYTPPPRSTRLSALRHLVHGASPHSSAAVSRLVSTCGYRRSLRIGRRPCEMVHAEVVGSLEAPRNHFEPDNLSATTTFVERTRHVNGSSPRARRKR